MYNSYELDFVKYLKNFYRPSSAYVSYALCPLCVAANNRHRQYESIFSCCLLDGNYRYMLRGLLILDNHVKPDFLIYLTHIYDSLKVMKLDIFSRRKFKCDACGDKFKADTEVEQHRKVVHPK